MEFSKIAKDPIERYQKLDKVGEGTYGLVYKARDRYTDEVTGERGIIADSGSEEDSAGERGRRGS